MLIIGGIPRHLYACLTTGLVAGALVLVAHPAAAQPHHHLLEGASGLDHGIPDFCSAPNVVSARSGAWSDPATWSIARVPAAGDKVVVAAGTSVTYDVVSQAALRCVGVEGALRFKPDVNTQLTVGDLLVKPSGELEVGTESEPIADGRTATIVIADKSIDTAVDPEQFGTGLIGLGRITMHGQPKLTFTRTAGELNAGQSSIDLAAAIDGWRPGDRLLLPDSRYLQGGERASGWAGIEIATVAQADGRQARLAAPLGSNHPGARDGDDVLKFTPHVGNLTRNVVVRSENPKGTRGHVILVSRADVDIRYAAFVDLGRTTLEPLDSGDASTGRVGRNQIGRYAVHFHHLFGPVATPRNGYQFTFVGNAIENCPKWGVTVHHAHYGLVKDNLLFNTAGSAIMTEDGTESDNVFERNFVVLVTGLGGRGDERGGSKPPDYGIEGAGIWLRGPNNIVRENVVANAATYGYMAYFEHLGEADLPKFKGADPSHDGRTVNLATLKMLDFSDNETYSSWTGVSIWFANNSTMSRMTIWHTLQYGYYGYPTNNVVLDGWTVLGSRAAMMSGDRSIGIWFGDYQTTNSVVVRANIQNMYAGLITPIVQNSLGPDSAKSTGVATIQDSYFRNHHDVRIEAMYFNGGGLYLPGKNTVIRNCKFDPPVVPAPADDRHWTITGWWELRETSNVVQSDRIFVYDYNQVKGDDFQVFYWSQAPDQVVQQTRGTNFIGAPEAGLTNRAAWDKYKLANAGEIAACGDYKDRILGFVCKTGARPPQTIAVPSARPPYPQNLRVVP